MLGCFGYRAVTPGTTTSPRLPLGTSGYFVEVPWVLHQAPWYFNEVPEEPEEPAAYYDELLDGVYGS